MAFVLPPLGLQVPAGPTTPNPLSNAPAVGTLPGLPTNNAAVGAKRDSEVHWKIETVEPKNSPWKRSNFVVVGQFPVPEEGIRYNVNNVIGDAGGLGLPHPFVQWIRGEKQTITLDAILFARHNGEDIKILFQSILDLMTQVPELGRPPVCRFTYGSLLSLLVLVQGGEINIRRPRVDGKARHIIWPITLVRFVPYKLDILSTSGIKESRHVQVADERRMYEILAAREFGTANALAGDRLRKRNRSAPFAAEDESLVKIPNADIILSETVTPEFHGFVPTNLAAQAAFLLRQTARKERFLVLNRK